MGYYNTYFCQLMHCIKEGHDMKIEKEQKIWRIWNTYLTLTTTPSFFIIFINDWNITFLSTLFLLCQKDEYRHNIILSSRDKCTQIVIVIQRENFVCDVLSLSEWDTITAYYNILTYLMNESWKSHFSCIVFIFIFLADKAIKC